MNQLAKRVRAGFTLVEMLVVITIIGILAALITAAAAGALSRAKDVKIKLEVDQLAGSIESFKQKYGAYPPTNLSCLMDGSGNYYANPQLTAFVARVFPRYYIAPGSSLQYQIYYDLYNVNGSVVLPNPQVINPQVALAFWLGGFTTDPTDPFNRNGTNWSFTRTALYPFNQTQLVIAGTTNPVQPFVPGVALGTPFGQMVYNAPYGNTAYCYFDYQSYGTLINTASGTPVVGMAANSSTVGIANATASAVTPEYLTAAYEPSFVLANGTGYVMPYVFDTNSSGAFTVGGLPAISDTFCKPTSFQIISAGQDGSFGTITAPTLGRLYPTGANYDLPPPGGGNGDDDNLTNFCEKGALESAKP